MRMRSMKLSLGTWSASRLFRAGEVIPFDVKPYRAIPFAFEHPKQRFQARDQLKQAIEAVLAPDYQVENPVTRARGFAAVSQHATPDMQVVLMEIESLKTRVQMAETAAAVAQETAMRATGSPPTFLGAVPAGRTGPTGGYSLPSGSLFSSDLGRTNPLSMASPETYRLSPTAFGSGLATNLTPAVPPKSKK